jgi:hypothetical protein
MMEVRDNAKGQTVSPRWDISQERAFMETLLGQRFNFLLVFFSLVMAGAVNSRESPFIQASVLSMGAIICFCLMLTINRSQQKLDLIIAIIMEDPHHPVTVINALAKGPSRRRLIGYYVPAFCFVALASWALLACVLIASQAGRK